jgi:hypothetical protein
LSFSEGATPPQFFDFGMMLDPEQWEMVLQVYAGRPVPALTLAYQLIEIKRSHTDFYSMGRTFFQRTIEGTLKPEHEEKLRQLGVKV